MACISTFFGLSCYTGLALAADYPPNIDYGDLGDFIVKRGTEHGRTADLTPIGPILINFPEAPGSSSVAIEELIFRDTAWDLSDLTNPTLIKILYEGAQQPIGAHATVGTGVCHHACIGLDGRSIAQRGGMAD